MKYQTRRQISSRQRMAPLVIGLLMLLLGMAAFSARLLHLGRTARGSASELLSTAEPARYEPISLAFARGYRGDGWQLYFNEPDASIQREAYTGGLESALAAAIDGAGQTLDIAVFELNSELLRDAIARAHDRGLSIRIVADDAHGIRNESPHLRQLQEAGIALRTDERAGLMHNKFAIIDQRRVWTGSWNYTINGSFRNNNNALALDSPQAAAAYQAEFDEMFERGEFGKRSRNQGSLTLALDGGEIDIIFAPEADELRLLKAEIAQARQSIRFMSFVFSLEDLAIAMLRHAAYAEVTIEGVFEHRNSLASWSQLPMLYCAGAAVRQDGNRYILHHKVIIIDDHTVIAGSFNFSQSAAESIDENILIIRHADIAALYLEEWRRIWDSAEQPAPGTVDCG